MKTEYFQIPCMRISREDIKTLDIASKKDINRLTDDQMQHIANNMKDNMMENGYWDSLTAAVEKEFEEGE